MSIPQSHVVYSPSQGLSKVTAFLIRDRDPTSQDVDQNFPLYQGWVNSQTKAIWYLEAVTSSTGVVSSQWRAVAPIVTSASAPTSSNYLYPLGQTWVDTTLNDYWALVAVVGTTATWVKISAGGGNGIDSITGNSGGAVFGDVNNNVGLTGATLYTVDGNPGSNTLVVNPRVNAYPMTPYVVGPVGKAGYQTIQSAITAANLAGGGYVSILPGTYNEVLTAFNNVNLIGFGNQNSPSVLVVGGVNIDTTAGDVGLYAQGISFQGSGQDAFVISGANDVNLSLLTCVINSTTNDGINCSTTGLISVNNSVINAGTGRKNLNITGNVGLRFYSTPITSTNTASVINSSSSITIAFSSVINDSFDITSGVISLANSGVGQIGTLPFLKLRTSSFGVLANCIVTSNSSSTFFIDGDGVGTSGSLAYFSTAPNPGVTFTIDPNVNQLPANEYPFATAGVTGSAVRGSASFDSSSFSVTDGFVSLTGGGLAIDQIAVDAATGPGTNPVAPSGTGQITITGGQIANAGLGNVIQSNSLAANSLAIQVQQSGTDSVLNTTKNGVAHFNSTQFSVSSGFVSLLGTLPSLSTAPAASQASSLSLGAAYQNPFGYDVVLVVYLNVTVNAGGNVACGVGPTNTPTQQTLITGLAVLGFLPVTIYLPKDYYALLSVTLTASIVGQQAFPV